MTLTLFACVIVTLTGTSLAADPTACCFPHKLTARMGALTATLVAGSSMPDINQVGGARKTAE